MKALVFERSLPRFAMARAASSIAAGRGARHGALSFTRDADEPQVDQPGWVRVRPRLSGICGSDLATVDGRTSRYFEPIVSFPFTPGHEVVGDLDDGARVVLVPLLRCETRGIEPPCDMCAAGRTNLCERAAFGHVEPGLQTGFCTDTGGGWSTSFVAHESQLRAVPDDMSDEAALLVEPAACAVHAAESIDDEKVGVIGGGTLGLLTVAALRRRRQLRGPLVVAAKHPHQRRLALELGADLAVEPHAFARAVRSATRSLQAGDQLTCGIDVVVDCVGSEQSLAQALQVVAPGGTVLVVGMPARVGLDLTSLWHREVELRGCYAYDDDDFTAAFDLVRDASLERLVSALYPLERYTDAVDHAANAGTRGAVKIAFDMRSERERRLRGRTPSRKERRS